MGLKENFYTIGYTVTGLSLNETFVACKDACNKIKEANVKEIDENKFLIEGKSKPSMHSFVGHKFILLVTKEENGSKIQIYYNYISPGNRPMRADLINPFFDELSKRVQLNEIKTETQLIHDYFLDNLTGQIKMDEIDQKFHCTACDKNAAFLHFKSSSICNSCFEEKYGPTRLRITNAQYYGGHKAYLAGGYFSKFQIGTIYLTDNYLIFSKGDKESSQRWEIIIPLSSVVIEKWGIEEESRRKDIVGGATALGDSGVAIGGGTMHDSGKAHHVVVPYIDENGIPQEPRFGASSIGGKVIRELSAKLYELIVKSNKNSLQTANNKQQSFTSKTKDDVPLQVLKMRLVKGEITKEDFEELKKMLE